MSLKTITICLAFLVCLTYTQELRVCPADYFFDSQHCEKCTPYCTCKAENTCSQCIDGYTMYDGNCIQCPQASGTLYGACSGCCSRTSGTILSCTDCVPIANRYSFLFAGRCILSEGCFEVDQKGFCTLCRTGFYPKDNICQSCDVSCSTCIDSDNCLTCKSGFQWKVADGGLCTACPTGCATCDDQVCTSCLNTYYFYEDHCLQCPDNCEVCAGGSACTSCVAGILVTSLCIECTDTIYGGSTGCLSCYEQNNFIRCSQCDDQYYLDTDNGVCRKCSDLITGAARCRDDNTPTQCLNDYDSILTNRYYLVGISCVLNIKSCKKISDINGNCSLCYPGYTLTAGSCVRCLFTGCQASGSSIVASVCTCSTCVRGYYLNGIVCTPCTTIQCGVCPGNVCSACLEGYYYDGTSCLLASTTNCIQNVLNSASQCLICADGYFLGSDKICYSCQSNCELCTNKRTCTKCSTGSILVGGFCVTYPPNCVQLDSSTVSLTKSLKCSLCEHGYYLSAGYCLECSVELGTLSVCEGLCPIDYYIQSLTIDTTSYEISMSLYAMGIIAIILGFLF